MRSSLNDWTETPKRNPRPTDLGGINPRSSPRNRPSSAATRMLALRKAKHLRAGSDWIEKSIGQPIGSVSQQACRYGALTGIIASYSRAVNHISLLFQHRPSRK